MATTPRVTNESLHQTRVIVLTRCMCKPKLLKRLGLPPIQLKLQLRFGINLPLPDELGTPIRRFLSWRPRPRNQVMDRVDIPGITALGPHMELGSLPLGLLL